MLSVVIPVWNGRSMLERAIGETLDYLGTLDDEGELLIVSDGCTDDPEEILGPWSERDSRLRFSRLDRHRGKGAAVRQGVLEAKGDQVAMLDVDLSAAPESLTILRRELEPGIDIVCGSRSLPDSNLPRPQGLPRRWAGKAFRGLVRSFTGLQIKDTQCGCKLFRTEKIRPVFESLKTEGWAFDVEVLAKAHSLGLEIREVPVTWNDSGESRVRLFKDGFQMLWTVVTLPRGSE